MNITLHRVLLLLLLYFSSNNVCGTNITVNWGITNGTSKTQTTLQVVVNPQLRRGASMHDGAFKALSLLGADYVRFVPWLPYPRLAVAELEAPIGNPLCGEIINAQTLNLACPNNATITDIKFASYGTPGGYCGAFTKGKCDADNTTKIVTDYCLGKSSCSIPTPIFGDPCYGVVKHLYVQAECSPNFPKTFWDFTLLDPMMEDFMEATKNHSVIINFSTIPQWMWVTSAPVTYPDDPNQVMWNYEQGTELRDGSFKEVADYYARLVQWYTAGGFTDELGIYHSSGLHYDIPFWEVLNEIESEHTMTPQYYTQIYDAIVTAIRKVQPKMKFVGLALSSRSLDWVEYFLDPSNHAPGIPLDWFSFHFYASCSNRTDPNTYQEFFPQADKFFLEVRLIEVIRQILSPSSKTTIDELGVILPDDNNDNPIPFPDVYWNAAGALFAYEFGNLVPYGIEVLGSSQLIGYTTQFPSVSLTNYPDGAPNGRFWVLFLLHKHFGVGDVIHTVVSDDSEVFASAYSTRGGRRILVVNKTVKAQIVKISGLKGGKIEYVDVTTATNPPAVKDVTTDTFTVEAFGVAVVSL